jgi:hypothetical protein
LPWNSRNACRLAALPGVLPSAPSPAKSWSSQIAYVGVRFIKADRSGFA